MQASILMRIGTALSGLLLVLMSALLVLLDLHLKDWLLSTKAVAVLGIAMSIFIGFRNTQAISRWWEARTLWGLSLIHI